MYGRGRRFPERTSIRIIELEKKQCFTVVKMEIFHVVLFIVNVFQLRINFFSSVEVEVNYGPSQLCFFWCSYFLHWNYEVHILCYIKDHWKRV